jgi:transketolase
MDAVQKAGLILSRLALPVFPRGEQLAAEGIGARVESMPCAAWFEASRGPIATVCSPARVRARVSVEAGIKQGWREYAGDAGTMVSLEHFGASADAARLYQEFGFTADAVAEAARKPPRK